MKQYSWAIADRLVAHSHEFEFSSVGLVIWALVGHGSSDTMTGLRAIPSNYCQVYFMIDLADALSPEAPGVV